MAFGMGRGMGGPRSYLTEEEKKNRPKLSKELLLRIIGYLKPYRIQFVFVFLAILISAVIGLFPSLITGRIVDEALVGKDMALLVKLLLLALLTIVRATMGRLRLEQMAGFLWKRVTPAALAEMMMMLIVRGVFGL